MFISDHETEVDFLNCESIAATVIEILRLSRTRPLTVGIHGDWGAGKSSILKMIETNLSKDERVLALWFNGWTFEGFDDAKTVFLEATISELMRQRPIADKAKNITSELLRRIEWLKVAKQSRGLAFNALTGLPSLDQLRLAMKTLTNVKKDLTNLDIKEIPEQVKEIFSFLKQAKDRDNIPDTIYAFREEFMKLLDKAEIDQLIILIDDLDRCLPSTAIETLEAIRLFLFVPKTAFVIGADEAMIEYAVQRHFPELPQSTGSLPYARNYLEKLVQIPFRIPALGAQETRAYVTLLLVQGIVGEEHSPFKALLAKVKDDLRRPWVGTCFSQADVRQVAEDKREQLDSAFVLAQQIAPMLAEGTKGNPRQIKRFLNALLVRQAVARSRGFEDAISQPILAKLMLAERFQPDFYDHVAIQAMKSKRGVSTDLNILELSDGKNTNSKQDVKASSARKKMDDNALETVNKWQDCDWLQRWRTIKPSIEDVDLRPYVFVSRNERLLDERGIADSQASLISRLCGSELEARAVEPEVTALSSTDADAVFAALRERILGTGSLKVTPPGMYGIAIVAKNHVRLQAELVNLISSLDVKKLGPWVVKGWGESVTDPQAKTNLQLMFKGWAEQDENRALSQVATAALGSKGIGWH